MIGNKYLQALYNYNDRDTSINQLLEILKFKDKDFINSLYEEEVNIDLLNEKEKEFLIISVSLIDHFFQIYNLDIPNWLRDERLSFSLPYYYNRRLSDFEKVKLLFTNPSPFRLRNVYFDLNSIIRI
ncbi:hypothetical protein [Clostridium sp. C8]|uniref:hypothetical protein n=1 Tax=Clostridium sp. C8 TaxID=1667357 RepID=UPI00062E532F|nr:hypothetical protein [Clostridium sp. C8]KLE14123.1 hypothetical protein AAT22_18390 [Clostridium sp. C8]